MQEFWLNAVEERVIAGDAQMSWCGIDRVTNSVRKHAYGNSLAWALGCAVECLNIAVWLLALNRRASLSEKFLTVWFDFLQWGTWITLPQGKLEPFQSRLY